MFRLVVLADKEIVPGFRLAGVEVVPIEDYETAGHKLSELMSDETVGLIAASCALVESLEPTTRRRVEMSYKPVVVSLPALASEPMTTYRSRRDYVAAMIRRAIGFHITLAGKSTGKPHANEVNA
jgi:vacuolar-type H+-ATPase subunit F/Vma7